MSKWRWAAIGFVGYAMRWFFILNVCLPWLSKQNSWVAQCLGVLTVIVGVGITEASVRWFYHTFRNIKNEKDI